MPLASPEEGMVPHCPIPAQSRVPGSTRPPPGPLRCPPGCTPLFTQLIPGICHPGRRTGGAALGLGFGEGRGAGGESRGWERHRHQSAGSKQSWRRETTTSCQALLKTRRAQKGKGRKTKGGGGGRENQKNTTKPAPSPRSSPIVRPREARRAQRHGLAISRAPASPPLPPIARETYEAGWGRTPPH